MSQSQLLFFDNDSVLTVYKLLPEATIKEIITPLLLEHKVKSIVIAQFDN